MKKSDEEIKKRIKSEQILERQFRVSDPQISLTARGFWMGLRWTLSKREEK